ncbi:DOPA 4,5-dioxygenase family protein [Pseudomonas sp. SA3-5]|uniref:DOPA 4,5-dioxygenase family protein n=1 Tax=Pseudomonas aestuarii TaxID=3018340 RepID=A0ABT4XC11_9PSED|nr:DOPA 4,5-dioxygenase family protein [Pseudomonas aestuarii]MDA7085736.1 DOPA 4,5-dioxygenase family protein [Pseudomonas aestuarii]
MTKRPSDDHLQYHAHVYFDGQSLALATSICEQAGELFAVKVGRIHQRLVGPHLRWSCQLSFDQAQFDQLLPWLENNRQGLSVLVHAVTGDNLADHTRHAAWLGEELPLDLSVFNA